MAQSEPQQRTSERSILSRYYADIRRKRPLNGEQEALVLDAMDRGDSAAFDRLVEHNLGFVVKIANEYRGLGVPLEDLLNEGNLGLLEAARRFDTKKGVKFLTYAIWWIRKTILQSIAEKSRVVRLPYAQQRWVVRVRQAETRLRTELGREPNRVDLANDLAIDEREVEKAQQARRKPHSLARPVRDDSEATIEEFVASTDRSQLEEIIDRETLDAMERVFNGLSEQQRRVIVLRFGLGTEPSMTLREVAERLGLSRERIRQVEYRALQAMRQRIKSPAKFLDRPCG